MCLSDSLTPTDDGRLTPVGPEHRSGGPPSISGGGPAPEPVIDFECDVTVLIKSGSCILHSKDHSSSVEDTRNRRDSTFFLLMFDKARN